MSIYKSRGVMPSQATASTLHKLIAEVGDREVARRLGQSRQAVLRMAARLPVNGSILFAAEAKLAQQHVA